MSTLPSIAPRARVGGFGHSASPDPVAAGRDSVALALGGRAPTARDLVIVMPNAAYDLGALHAAAQLAAGPAPVVGATTVGAFTHAAQVPFGCVAAFIAGDGISFGVCHADREDGDIAGFTRRAAQTARDRAGARHPHSVLMLLCDGLTPDQRAMARGAYEVTGATVPLVGGAAGDDLHWRATSTFGEGRVSSRGLVAVWMNSERPVAVSVDHGWRPLGRPMLVTRAEGATIHELDGQPALDVYVAERGAPLPQDGRSFGETCMERPIGLPDVHGRYAVRQVHERTAEGGVILTTGVPEQSVIQVMESDADSLLQGAARAAHAAAELLTAPARLALVFSCCTRTPLLGDRPADEVGAIVDSLGGAPAGGFFTCGEFARVTGSTGIHNSSVALLVL